MSFTSPSVVSSAAVSPPSGGDPGGGATAGGVAGEVLAFTGTGPGTLPLAIVGLGAIVVGAVAALAGRKRPARGAAHPTLPDLSELATDLAPRR